MCGTYCSRIAQVDVQRSTSASVNESSSSASNVIPGNERIKRSIPLMERVVWTCSTADATIEACSSGSSVADGNRNNLTVISQSVRSSSVVIEFDGCSMIESPALIVCDDSSECLRAVTSSELDFSRDAFVMGSEGKDLMTLLVLMNNLFPFIFLLCLMLFVIGL